MRQVTVFQREPRPDPLIGVDCGTFEVRDQVELHTQGKVLFDNSGHAVRLVQHVWGVDTLYNSVSGKSVSGSFNDAEVDDFVKGTATQNGQTSRIVMPGLGVVFINVGKIHHRFRRGTRVPCRTTGLLQRQHRQALRRAEQLDRVTTEPGLRERDDPALAVSVAPVADGRSRTRSDPGVLPQPLGEPIAGHSTISSFCLSTWKSHAPCGGLATAAEYLNDDDAPSEAGARV